MRRSLLLSVVLILLVSCSPEVVLRSTSTPTPSRTQAPANTPTIIPTNTPDRPIATVAPAKKSCVVDTGINSGTVNIRAGPGTRYRIVIVVKEGTRLTVLMDSSEWVHVIVSDEEGYIYSRYCRKE